MERLPAFWPWTFFWSYHRTGDESYNASCTKCKGVSEIFLQAFDNVICKVTLGYEICHSADREPLSSVDSLAMLN
jgi:hypothetical protein